MDGVGLPEARVALPDAFDGALRVQAAEGLPPRAVVAPELELQATLIAFSFSASAFNRES